MVVQRSNLTRLRGVKATELCCYNRRSDGPKALVRRRFTNPRRLHVRPGVPLRSRSRITLLWLFLVCTVLASAESPSSLYNKGKKAEARQDYIAAYDFYKQAYDQKPEELKYRVSFQRLRFLA